MSTCTILSEELRGYPRTAAKKNPMHTYYWKYNHVVYRHFRGPNNISSSSSNNNKLKTASSQMPGDLDMILSASPPLFSHSALADFHYAYNHQNMPTGRNHHHFPSRKNMLRLNALNTSDSRDDNVKGTVVTTPIRPILMIKTVQSPVDDEVVVPEVESPTSPSGRDKKRVWFADDKGLALAHVRIMTEPSDCPPRWTDTFLEHVTGKSVLSHGFACGGVKSRRSFRVGRGGQMKESHWEPSFPQPASDYVAFRHKLEGENVSLENVIVKEEGENAPLVTGTIKVKNISFNKEVTVRFTFDRWLSHKDSPCTYVPNGLDSNFACQYDTFSFSEPIPQTADKYETVEFCVKYSSDGNEFWDSNGGTNYRLRLVEKPVPEPEKPAMDPVMARYTDVPRFADPVTADFDKWTEFASWNHLINDSPYW